MINSNTQEYIEFYEGTLPIILSAPHGGEILPKEIKTRTSGVFEKDDYTKELTLEIIKEFEKSLGKTPYAVIASISREKIDLNRKKEEAFEDKKALKIYDRFHNLIKFSKNEVEKKFAKGIYIDIHGQSHPHNYLEFGYMLDNSTLNLHETQLKEYQEQSSIKNLAKFSKQSFFNQLKGAFSMGSLMTNLGFDSVPSVKLPYAADNNYYEGAYNTYLHGSLDKRNISGIQIEFPYVNCRDTKENRKRCAKAFVSALTKFLEVHLEVNFPKIDCFEQNL